MVEDLLAQVTKVSVVNNKLQIDGSGFTPVAGLKIKLKNSEEIFKIDLSDI